MSQKDGCWIYSRQWLLQTTTAIVAAAFVREGGGTDGNNSSKIYTRMHVQTSFHMNISTDKKIYDVNVCRELS